MHECKNAPLGIASVPVQQADFSNVYSQEEAFRQGTIFPELNLPFFVTEEEGSAKGCLASCSSPLKEIMELGFYTDDLTLYLDTHPDDTKALNLFHELLQKKSDLVTAFAKTHFTLTKNCVPQAPTSDQMFAWGDGPAPWEGVCE